MSQGTARDSVVKQISYALSVQILVDQKLVADPESRISKTQRLATEQAAERAIEQFERTLLVEEVKKITDGKGFWYGVSQAVLGAFVYSLVLLVIALIVKENGIDIISALTARKQGH